MRIGAMRSLVVVLVLCLAVAGTRAEPVDGDPSTQAYVSLLYGDDFVFGLRVLGQSLRETGTKRCAAVQHRRTTIATHPIRQRALRLHCGA